MKRNTTLTCGWLEMWFKWFLKCPQICQYREMVIKVSYITSQRKEKKTKIILLSNTQYVSTLLWMSLWQQSLFLSGIGKHCLLQIQKYYKKSESAQNWESCSISERIMFMVMCFKYILLGLRNLNLLTEYKELYNIY